MVIRFHQAYNLTTAADPVGSKPKHVVGHFSDTQRHPQKDLMSHIHRLGLKLR